VTPTLSGYSFSPASRSYSNVTAAQTVQDYAATAIYQISGTITASGAGLAGVSLGASTGATCDTTNSSGQYTCSVAEGWSGTFTPSLSGYVFTPVARTHTNVNTNQSAQNFTAVASSASTTIYFIHVDHLDTPRLVANNQGQTVWRWDQQEPFGVTVPDENPSGLGAFEFPLRFPGQYADKETNLAYNYNRDYDAAIGRYAESDPIGLRAGLNTYAYVDSKPLLFSDEFGLQGLEGRRRSGPIWPDASAEAQQRLARQITRFFNGEEQGCCPDCGEPPPPQIDRVPPSRPHFPCPGDHWVYFEYHQSPYPDCTCRLVRRFGGCLSQGGYPPGWTGGRPPRNPPVRPDRDF